MTRSTGYVAMGLATLFLLFGIGCGDDNVGDNNNNENENDDAGVLDSTVQQDSQIVDAEVTPDASPWVCNIAQCETHTLECGDCIDNDGDGLIDSQDPECLGPCDDTEGPALMTGVGGEVGGTVCLWDCYWDYGNGPDTQDGCIWDHRCDPEAVAPDYPPEGASCAYDPALVGTDICPTPQDQTCIDNCLPLTPNGCDCFGCCYFNAIGYSVWIGHYEYAGSGQPPTGTCTLALIADEAACPRCTQVQDCANECGECELCVGDTTLPPGCTDEERCDPGVQPCGLPSDPACPVGLYCITGCCIQVPQ